MPSIGSDGLGVASGVSPAVAAGVREGMGVGPGVAEGSGVGSGVAEESGGGV